MPAEVTGVVGVMEETEEMDTEAWMACPQLNILVELMVLMEGQGVTEVMEPMEETEEKVDTFK
jgi:hypothetical protein